MQVIILGRSLVQVIILGRRSLVRQLMRVLGVGFAKVYLCLGDRIQKIANDLEENLCDNVRKEGKVPRESNQDSS